QTRETDFLSCLVGSEMGISDSDYDVVFENGVLYIPAALLDDAYENETNYLITISLPYGNDGSFLLWVAINPQGNELDWLTSQAA
ncbi:MAG: hypothetical protein K2M95_05470, partial [Clostridiales bacterium]|nr:hypothetical protein [Clostridiales bacterium]